MSHSSVGSHQLQAFWYMLSSDRSGLLSFVFRVEMIWVEKEQSSENQKDAELKFKQVSQPCRIIVFFKTGTIRKPTYQIFTNFWETHLSGCLPVVHEISCCMYFTVYLEELMIGGFNIVYASSPFMYVLKSNKHIMAIMITN